MMHLAAYIQGVGAAQAAWRSPRTDAANALSLNHWIETARVAEAACFDAYFLADVLAVGDQIATDSTERPDPIAVLSAITGFTEHIGLVGTSSTTFNDPFTVARQFATLDHLSQGRAGWNVVTTAVGASAANYGSASLPDHADRYARAEEFVEVVAALWDGWEEDAIVADAAAGRYADLARIHPAAHAGEHFQVTGPLPLRRSPQGRPVIAQAGSSGPGMNLSAAWAEMTFTTQWDIESSREFVTRTRELSAQHGREPGSLKALPGIMPFVGSTEEEAQALAREFGSFVDVEGLSAFLTHHLGNLDLSDLDPDAPLPDLRPRLPENASVSRPRLYIETALREQLTLRQLAQRIALTLGHRPVIGTPEAIADDLEQWFTAGAADGFIVLPADLPQGLCDFGEQVVPILQQRGLFRREYTGSTLREHLSE
ncbi:LLM class flavin-dependent oxidoreductase [Microbacterium sp.]|uniref:LLM class flavin-dependent oxidoreductase n=1 Tax=Microbacterium sp. TaxID=51671 RepID=UPI0026193FEF|nr:LLM class flavin-dependent oxidoreductase [Microbacterium sp.]